MKSGNSSQERPLAAAAHRDHGRPAGGAPTEAAAIRRSTQERDVLVTRFLPLVRYVVARLPVALPASVDRDDLYSAGVLGLMHAATNFDPARGASFKTFAYTAIRGAILDELRRQDPVPRSRRARLRRMEHAAAELRSALDREPTPDELAEALGSTVDDLEDDLQALHTARVLSLDEPDAGGRPLAGEVGDRDAIGPAEQVLERERVELLAKAIADLPPQDRHVVVLYYHEQLYLKEIGSILGVTESRISQILTRATERLRRRLAASA